MTVRKMLLLMMIFSVNVSFALNTRVATFSVGRYGGEEFKNLTGVIEVNYGVAYGQIHREVIQIEYNEDIISYRQLLNAFFRMIDPTDMLGSFEDRDVVYSPAIYTSNDEQTQLANLLIQKIQKSKYFNKPIVVRVISEFVFVMSEDRPKLVHHEFYKSVTARSSYIRNVWDKIPQEFLLVDSVEHKGFITMEMRGKYKDFVKPSKKQLRDDLTEMQFAVTQLGATEPPFFEYNFTNNTITNEATDESTDDVANEVVDSDDVTNEVANDTIDNSDNEIDNDVVEGDEVTDEVTVDNSNNINRRGIYVDVVSGEPLFSSIDRFESNTGWPSFKSPITHDFIVEREDFSLFYKRIEIRSKYADSHIGYIVDDYYQVNSAALRFVPYDQMEAEGYEEYKRL